MTTPPRTRPRLLTRDTLTALTNTDRARYADERAVWHANLGPIVTPQMSTVHDDLWTIVGSNQQDGDKVKGAVALDAYPGLGKTTIATAFGAQFHRQHVDVHGDTTAEGHARVPVCYIALTSNTTMRTLNQMICQFYGVPGANRGTAAELARRAQIAMNACETEVVIVDDVHFIRMNRKDGVEVTNHFKWLANTFPITFVFIGVGLTGSGLMTEGLSHGQAGQAQTARRWTPLTVDPFEVQTATGRAAWRRLLLSIERDIILVNTHRGMIANDLSDYLYARSTGHFTSLMSLITRGCYTAIRTGTEALTANLLDRVKIDAAAETARLELESAIKGGYLSTTKEPTVQPRPGRQPRTAA